MTKTLKSKSKINATQLALFIIAGVSVLCAFLRAEYPNSFDDKTAMFLGIAAAVLVIPQITKFKGFGFEFEKQVEQLKQEVKNVGQVVGGLEKAVGPGSKSAVPMPELATTSTLKIVSDSEDPNKGQFGESSQQGQRKLTAAIKPLSGPKSARCQVTIKVESTDKTKPLTGKIKLHLHPTFGRWASYDLDVVDGVAKDQIISFGAFTIGAETDDGTNKLELDLMDVPGGTQRFYEM